MADKTTIDFFRQALAPAEAPENDAASFFRQQAAAGQLPIGATEEIKPASPTEQLRMLQELPSAVTTEATIPVYQPTKPPEPDGFDFNIGEPLARFGKGFAQGVIGITAGAAYPFSPELSKAMKEQADQDFPLPDPGIAGTVGQFIGNAAFSAPAVAFSAAGAPLAAAGTMLGASALFGASGAGNMLERLDAYTAETGIKFSTTERALAASTAGVIDAGLEAAGLHYGINRIVKAMNPKTTATLATALIEGNAPVITGLLKSAAVEAGEEFSEELTGDAVASALIGAKAYEGAATRYPMAALGGAVGGVALGGMGHMVQKAGEQKPPPPPPPPLQPLREASPAMKAALKAAEATTAPLEPVADSPVKVEAPAKAPKARVQKAPTKTQATFTYWVNMSTDQLYDMLITEYGFTPEQIQVREDLVARQPDADTARALFNKPKRKKRQQALDVYTHKFIETHPFEAAPVRESVEQKEAPPRALLISKHGFTEAEIAGFEKIIDEKETKDAALNQWSGKVHSKRQRALQRYMLSYIETKNLPLMEEGKDYWYGGVPKKDVAAKGIISFRTSKGSSYTVKGSTTQRTKSKHEGLEHEGDEGLKEPSELTIYIPKEKASEIGMGMTSSSAHKRIYVDHKNKKIVLLEQVTTDRPYGKNSFTETTFETEPRVGLSPLELWEQDTKLQESLKGGPFYRKVHPGNEIVEIVESPQPTVKKSLTVEPKSAGKKETAPDKTLYGEKISEGLSVDAKDGVTDLYVSVKDNAELDELIKVVKNNLSDPSSVERLNNDIAFMRERLKNGQPVKISLWGTKGNTQTQSVIEAVKQLRKLESPSQTKTVPVLKPPAKAAPRKSTKAVAPTLERAIIANGGLWPGALNIGYGARERDITLEEWAKLHHTTVEHVLDTVEALEARGILDKQGRVIEQEIVKPEPADAATEHLNSVLAEGHAEQTPAGSKAEARMQAADAAMQQLHDAGFDIRTVRKHYRKMLRGKQYLDKPQLIAVYAQTLIRNKAKVEASFTARQAARKAAAQSTVPSPESDAIAVEEATAEAEADTKALLDQTESLSEEAILEQLIREQEADNTNIVQSEFDETMDAVEQTAYRELSEDEPAAKPRKRRGGKRPKASKGGLSDDDIADMLTDYQVRVFHGSGHAFDQFSSRHIGSGEGAQAYGYGLYFTELEDIARWYAETTRKNNPEYLIGGKKLDSLIDWYTPEGAALGIAIEQFLDLARQATPGQLTVGDVLERIALYYHRSSQQEQLDKLDSILRESFKPTDVIDRTKTQHLYKVTLHKGKQPGEYTWLDWDEPVTEEILAKIDKALVETPPTARQGILRWFRERALDRGLPGRRLYYALNTAFGSDKAASEFLLKAGIDGIRYAADGGTLKAKNYVVFDDKAITIDERVSWQQRSAAQPPLAVQREAALVHDLITPLFKSGLIHGLEMVPGSIVDPATGREANAAIVHFADGRSVLRLSKYIELNTIGHEGGHSLIRRLGSDHPYVAALTRLFGGDIEAALDALGDVFYGRVTLPESMYRRVVRWMRGLWLQAEMAFGREGSQQAILDGLVDYMTQDKAVRPIDKVRADWEQTFRKREAEYQTKKLPAEAPRQPDEKKLLDFLDGPGRDFYRTTLDLFEKTAKPPGSETAPRKQAEKYMNAKSMSRIITTALRGQALTPAELHALSSYTTYATQEIQKASDATDKLEVKQFFYELAQPFVIAFDLASTMQGVGLEILKHEGELRPKGMAEWIMQTEKQLQRKLTDVEKKRLFGAQVDWSDPVAAAVEMNKHTKVKLNDIFKWYIATSWLSGTAIPTNLLLNFSKLAYFNVEALISAGINEAVSTATFGKVQRQRMLNELGPRMRSQYYGLKRGAAAAGKELLNKTIDPDSYAYLELGLDATSVWKKIARQAKSPTVAKLATGIDFTFGSILRAMSAGDIMVRGAYYMDSIAQQCMQEARAQGLHKGTPEFEAFVRGWKEGPEHKALAKALAADGVLMGPAGKVLRGIKSIRDAFGPIGTYLLPFIHTPGKVIEYSYNRVPVAPLITRTIMHGKPNMPGETWSDVVARQLFGATLTALMLAWMDRDKDHFVGGIPDSPAERLNYYARGVAPWSIGSPELGYVSIDRDPHFAWLKTLMITKQAIDKAEQDPNAFKTRFDIFTWGANKAMKELMNDSMFGQFMQPLRGPESTASFIERIPANLVPLKGLFHAGQRMYEAAAYGMIAVKDRDGWINKIEPDPLRRTVAHAFGNTGDLPDKLTVWGEPMVVRTSLLNEWIPYKIWQASTEPLEVELHRLGMVEPTFQYPGHPGQTVTIGKKEIELPDELYRQHIVWSGKLLKEHYQKVMATKYYQAPTTKDSTRALLLQKVDSRVGDMAVRKIKSEIFRHHRELLEAAGLPSSGQ